MKAQRIVLIGDSIIDNGVYVKPGEPDVAQQVRSLMSGFEVDMRAVDGAVTDEVSKAQTHNLNSNDLIVVSSGGNDALSRIELLDSALQVTSRSFLVELWNVREAFRSSYATLLSELARDERKLLVLTIYNPSFAAHGVEEEDQKAAESALSIFNDVIQQEAQRHGCDILELRTLFDHASDYANPIEPSAIGGAKLANAIRNWAMSKLS